MNTVNPEKQQLLLLEQILEICQKEISINEIELANLEDDERLYLEGRTDLAVKIEDLFEQKGL